MKIGIFGGTFNPVHLGHLLLAQTALEVCGLDRVWFVPCARPPHKPAHDLAPARDRIAMLRAAVCGNGAFSVSRVEVRRGGLSFAVETLEILQRDHPGHRWFFLAGMDSLLDLHRWREVHRLLHLCRFVTLARPGVDPPVSAAALHLPEALGRELIASMVPGRRLDLSSSEIRQRVASGRSIRYLVPEAVDGLIRHRGLYRPLFQTGE